MDWETRQQEIPLLKHIIAGTYGQLHFRFKFVFLGSCAGIVEHVGMFPVDTIKVSS